MRQVKGNFLVWFYWTVEEQERVTPAFKKSLAACFAKLCKSCCLMLLFLSCLRKWVAIEITSCDVKEYANIILQQTRDTFVALACWSGRGFLSMWKGGSQFHFSFYCIMHRVHIRAGIMFPNLISPFLVRPFMEAFFQAKYVICMLKLSACLDDLQVQKDKRCNF